jgi:hypothetical protein
MHAAPVFQRAEQRAVWSSVTEQRAAANARHGLSSSRAGSEPGSPQPARPQG